MFTISISLFTNNLVTLHCYKTRDPFCFHSETFNHTNFLYTTVMYSKDELVSKSISELEDIANTLGINSSKNSTQEELVYAILDQQAIVEGSKNPLGGKRKRTRILKKDTDRVYSVHGKEGENYDVKKNKIQQPSEKTLFSDVTTANSNNANSNITPPEVAEDNQAKAS